MTFESMYGTGPFTVEHIPPLRMLIALAITSMAFRAPSFLAVSSSLGSVSINGRQTYVFGMVNENTLSSLSPTRDKSVPSISIVSPILSPHVHKAKQ